MLESKRRCAGAVVLNINQLVAEERSCKAPNEDGGKGEDSCQRRRKGREWTFIGHVYSVDSWRDPRFG